MPKSTIISSFKRKLPTAFLAALLIFIGIEAYLYTIRPRLIGDFWNKFLINEHRLIELDRDFDFLIMGDSVQKTGIRPAKVAPNILNLGLPGAKPLGQYLLLQRYLREHAPPEAIFLYLDPEDPRDALYVILRFFVSPEEFIEIYGDLSPEERRTFLLRYFVSLDLRKTEAVRRDKYKGSNKEFVDTMIKNRGFMPSPRENLILPENYFETHRERVAENIHITDRDMKYLDKFMALANDNDIRVMSIRFPEPAGLFTELERTGFNRRYLAFLEILRERYPEAFFSKKPILVIDDQLFGDMSHVNRKGSLVYTRDFELRTFDPFLGSAELDIEDQSE
ncbi:MAG: hypothetical protein GF392_00670, partial [Candidatus Omnitrophica bacterium]|nr:hypothetical protein [Candidatus Omnitrophota bacterium]